MSGIFIKVLLTIGAVGNGGHSFEDKLKLVNKASQTFHRSHGDTIRSEWQDFVSMVNQKFDDMERLLAEKDSRIKQLEEGMAGQRSEMKQLKTGIASFEKAIFQRDQTVSELSLKLLSNFSENKIVDGDRNFKHMSDERDQVEEKEMEILPSPQKRVAPSVKPAVTFHVYLSSNKVVTNNNVVIYDHEALDQGDGYSPGVGLYTVPESGTYVLTWTTLSYTHTMFQTLLVVNGSVSGVSWTDSEDITDIHQTSATVVVCLDQGDNVFIRMGPTYGHGTIISNGGFGYSTFSGWKLD
ncbi:uncharacterized protein [Argopecten irradians]|uniref:uncharacterized protein n=1 Tax=Argopecten irradians TaxID=31199 RepID=UPI00371437BC